VRNLTISLLAGTLAFVLPTLLQAQTTTPSTPEIPKHPWMLPSPNNEHLTYFVNLQDGDVKETPFVARFGLTMRRLVPAGKTAGTAGHHHLLINQDLPWDFKKPLPFTDQYIHFGKGQTEMVVDLPPGTYNFRLVLADKGHIPYFVYSKPLEVTVAKQNKTSRPESAQGALRIELTGIASREAIRPPFRLQFHAGGMNVSDKSAKTPDTGHFKPTMEKAGQKLETIAFTGGQTESWLNHPPGNYNLRLELVNNVSGKPMATRAEAMPLTVNNTPALALLTTAARQPAG